LFAKTGLSRLFHDDFCQDTLSAGWLLLLFSKCMQVKKIKKAKTDAVAGGVTAEMEVIAIDRKTPFYATENPIVFTKTGSGRTQRESSGNKKMVLSVSDGGDRNRWLRRRKQRGGAAKIQTPFVVACVPFLLVLGCEG